jgi:hypothetical protein
MDPLGFNHLSNEQATQSTPPKNTAVGTAERLSTAQSTAQPPCLPVPLGFEDRSVSWWRACLAEFTDRVRRCYHVARRCFEFIRGNGSVKVGSGGGFRAIWYTLKKGREAGGVWKLFKAMRSRNSCKTCAVGMGGQKGGMVNELGHSFEVCKKSMQAMVADMQPGSIRIFGNRIRSRNCSGFPPGNWNHSGG